MFRTPFSLVALIAIVLMAVGFVGVRPASAQRSGDYLTSIETKLNTTALQPGQQAVAAIAIAVQDGYHAQSSESELLAFSLKTTDAPAIEAFKPVYPKGHIEHYPGLDPQSIYSGKFVVYVPFEVKADAEAGDVTLAGTFMVQVCDDKGVCFQPQTMKWSIATKVVAATDRVEPANAELFKDFDPKVWATVRSGGTTTAPTTGVTPAGPAASSGEWKPFSDEALRAARAAGSPVLVKFTADWCVNCHYVERTVFSPGATIDELKARGVVLLKADLTADDAPGWALLRELNPSRSIPFTAVWKANAPEPSQLVGIYSGADLLSTLGPGEIVKQSATNFLGYELKDAPLLAILGCALVVGVVLNAVPCVLPVLPLKAMGFYEAAHHSRGRSLMFGAAFSLGIIATFGAIAVIVISLNLDWGRMFSIPWFAALLTILLLAAAAQAFGLLEFVLPASIARMEASHNTLTGNFLWGIITALLSTPCTIGMFAAVIAIALQSGSFMGAIILMTVGAGMALPYLVLSGFPQLAANFPRTGPWPNVVKQLMAFFLLATAVFFAGPLLPQALRGDMRGWLIFGCVAAGAAFLIGKTVQIAPKPRPILISAIVAVGLLAIGHLVRQIV